MLNNCVESQRNERETMGKMPIVSVVIPTRNAAVWLPGCLESLRYLEYPPELLDILIVDGESTDSTQHVAKQHSVRIVNNVGHSVCAARNLSLEHVKGELVAFTDADCRVTKNWLTDAVQYFSDSQVGGVGGPTLSPEDQSYFAQAVNYLFRAAAAYADAAHIEHGVETKEVTHLPGCNMMFRKEILADVMPIDEHLITGEDVELCRRVRRQGYKLLWVPEMQVWHYNRKNPRAFWRQMYRYAIGRLQIGKRDWRWLHPFHVLVGVSPPIFLLVLVFLSLAWPLALAIFGIFIVISLIITVAMTASFRVGCALMIAGCILIGAWSCGFWRELVLPTKRQS